MKPRALVITGPTTSGKTDVAYATAKEVGGEVINGDRYYLYRDFPIGSGASDSVRQREVRKHLYQVLTPDEAVPEPPEYAMLASKAIDEVRGRSAVPIVELLCSAYLEALKKREPLLVLALRIRNLQEMEDRMRGRLSKAMAHGLIDETQQGLERGQGETFVMQSFVFIELAKYLRGEKTLAEAEDEIIRLAVATVVGFEAKFHGIDGIKWIDHDVTDPKPTIMLATKYAQDLRC